MGFLPSNARTRRIISDSNEHSLLLAGGLPVTAWPRSGASIYRVRETSSAADDIFAYSTAPRYKVITCQCFCSLASALSFRVFDAHDSDANVDYRLAHISGVSFRGTLSVAVALQRKQLPHIRNNYIFSPDILRRSVRDSEFRDDRVARRNSWYLRGIAGRLLHS
jgi:hypothetical protein